MKKNKRKTAIIILSILGILDLIALITCIVIQVVITPEKQEKPAEEEVQQEIVKKPKNIVLYKPESENYYCTEPTEDCNIKYDEIKTNTNTAFIIRDISDSNSYLPKYILYYDDGIYFYNTQSKEVNKLNLEYLGEKAYYEFILDNKDNAVAIIYNLKQEGKKTSGYYDLSSNKILYKDKYETISSTWTHEFIEGSNVGKDDIPVGDFIEVKTGNIYFDKSGPCDALHIEEFNGKRFYVITSGCTGAVFDYKVYDTNKKRIGNRTTEYMDISDDGYLYLGEGNVVNKYNTNGELISTVGPYEKIIDVIENYVLHIKDNEVILTDGVEEYKIHDWKDEYYYHKALSGYYNSVEHKELGIYIIIEYNGFNEGPGVEYHFNPTTKEIKKYDLDVIGGYAKPVLYLYPEKTTKVTVNFEKEENLTTTYPKFNDQWEMTVSPNGDMYDKAGKYYYGLYWEEDQNHTVDFKEGFYVTKDNAIEFLEEKLTYIGLNDKERNEFIMYWLPIIEKNEHNLIYFELTEERDSFNKLQISPKPDSMLRIAIHVKKVNGPKKIKEQKLTSFERKGFTAVEWGGISYN